MHHATTIDQELDVRGLSCPLPILRTKNALKRLDAGKVLKVVATDPGSVRDFEAFARQSGNELLNADEADGAYTFLLRKQ